MINTENFLTLDRLIGGSNYPEFLTCGSETVLLDFWWWFSNPGSTWSLVRSFREKKCGLFTGKSERKNFLSAN